MPEINQFSSSTAIDQESITKNSQGALQVSKPSEFILANFEDQSLDGWTASGFYTSESQTDFTVIGEYGWRLRADNSQGNPTGTFEKDIDLTGRDTLIVPFYLNNEDSGNFEILINSTVEETPVNRFVPPASGQSYEAEVDVSSYSGTNTVTLRLDCSVVDAYISIDIDAIQFSNPVRRTFDTGVSQ